MYIDIPDVTASYGIRIEFLCILIIFLRIVVSPLKNHLLGCLINTHVSIHRHARCDCKLYLFKFEMSLSVPSKDRILIIDKTFQNELKRHHSPVQNQQNLYDIKKMVQNDMKILLHNNII